MEPHYGDISGNAGLQCPDKRAIIIDGKLKGEEKSLTVIHELMHALFHRLGLKQVLDSGTEEMLCEMIPVFLVEHRELIIKILRSANAKRP